MKVNQEANKSRQEELKLGEKKSLKTLPKTKAELLQLVYELQAHQIELEMRIEKLDQARAESDAAVRQYHDLMENSLDLICAHDLQGNLLFVNLAGTRLSEYPNETLLAMNLREVLAPDVRPQFSGYLAQVQAEGQAHGIMKIQTASGRIRYLEYNNHLQSGEMPASIVYAIARDITERIQAEAAQRHAEIQFRSLFEQSHDAVFILDLQGRHLAANQRAADMLGYTLEEIRGLSFLDISAELPQSMQTLEKLLSGENITPYERIFRRKDGSLVTVEINAELVRDANNQPLHILSVARDITERKQADEAIRYQASLLENVNEAVTALDDRFVLTAWNRRAEEMFGWKAEEVLGRPEEEVFRSKFVDIDRSEALRTVKETGQFRGELIQYRKDGASINVEASTLMLRNEKGQTTGYVTISRDITKRKRAEEALHESEERFRRTLDNMFEGCMILGFDWKYLYVNDAAARHGHAKREELLGRTMIEMYPGVEQSAVFAYYRRCMEERTPQHFESSYTFSDGSIDWYELSAQPAPEGIFVVSIDITEHKRAEEQLHLQSAALKAAANTIVITDREGLIEWANPSFAALTGFDPSEAIGKNPLELTKSGKQDVAFYKNLWDTILSGQVWRGELVNRRKDGSLYTEEMTITPLLDSQGEITHFIAVKQDITERKQAEKKLNDSQAQLTGIFNSAMDAIVSTDANQNIVIFNTAAEVVFDCPQSEAIGQPLERFIPQRFHAIHRKHMEHFAESGMTNRMIGHLGTVIGLRCNGEEFPIEASISKIRLAGSDLFTIILRDVTERKRAEETLRQREEQYRTLVEQVPAIVYIDDATTEPGQTLYVSPQVETILGITPDEWLQGDLDIWTTHIHPDDRPRILNEYLRCFTDGEPMDSEYRMIAGDGRLLWIREQAARLCDESSKPRLIHGMMYDITERKQAEESLRMSEEKYRTLIEQLPAVVYVDILDGKGTTLFISPQVEAILGVSVKEWAEGDVSIWRDLIHPEDRQQTAEAYQRYKKIGQPYEHEYRMITRGGKLIWIQDKGKILESSTGELLLHGVMFDITERKQAEEKLERRADEFAALYETASEISGQNDLPELLKTITARAAKLLGVTGGGMYLYDEKRDELQVVASTDAAILIGATLHMGEGMAGRVAQSRQPLIVDDYGQWEHRARKYEGIPFKAIVEVPMLYGGKMIGILVAYDIGDTVRRFSEADMRLLTLLASGVAGVVNNAREFSERKQAEEALRTSEERFKTMFVQAPLGIALVGSLTGNIYEVNPRFAEMTGRSMEEMAKIDWMQITHPDDIQADLDNMALLNSGKINGYQMEKRYLHPDGKAVWINMTIAPLKVEDKEHPRHLCMIEDITERKRAEEALRQAEEKYRDIFENSMDGIFQSTPTGRFITVNPALARLWGYASPEDLIDSITDIEHQIYVDPERRAEFARLMKEAGKVSAFEYQAFRKDGSVIWVSESAHSAWDAQGTLHYYEGAVKDITERKHAEKLIHQYASELEMRVQERTVELVRANRAKDEFLANMSHELRTPLNGILGFSETLLEKIRGPLNERQEQAVEIIQSSGQHLLGLINDILDLSKIESGTFEFQPQDIPVNDACRSSLNFIKQLANRKHITVDYSLSPNITTIHADPRRLKQILVNLLNNAVKFTPENGNVKLEARADAGAGLMRFSVTDTGIGITAEDQQKLFKPFVQVDSSLSRQYEGTGLGLSLVKKLVEIHGGSVGLESEFGKGSCFTFSLPWKQKVEETKNRGLFKLGSDEHRAATASISTVRGKVLIADDNEANVIMVKDYLEDRGYQVRIAHDGGEAIQMAFEWLPDIILMDIQMPYINGFEATQRLRADPRFAAVPIIALTAFAMSGDRERCLAAGMNEYMSKPVKLKELSQMIERLLESPASE